MHVFTHILRHIRKIILAGLIIGVAGAVGCTSNKAYRITTDPKLVCDCGKEDCSGDSAEFCETRVIEKYDNFDLAFIEFTDRGNLFSRERYQKVISHIETTAKNNTVLVVVYVHGWKHNASYDDSNVSRFRDALKILSAPQQGQDVVYGRRLIGVYLGWRGLSLSVPGLKELTYWDRKTVAQHVGNGGVTEVLLRLKHASVGNGGREAESPIEDVYVIIGHSLGGAIVFTALDEVITDQMITASQCDQVTNIDCPDNTGLAHVTMLINPAIEANEGLHLKELAISDYPENMLPLLHVVSTDADTSNRTWFPLGQKLAMLTWKKTEFERDYGESSRHRLSEAELGSTTIGNYTAFHTHRLTRKDEGKGPWSFQSCDISKCETNGDKRKGRIAQGVNSPLRFVYTDRHFMENHNDIFNSAVVAYIAASVEEFRLRTKRTPLGGCTESGRFSMDDCIGQYLEIVSKGCNDDKYRDRYPQFCRDKR